MVRNNIYENKTDYNAYGFSIKNEINKTYQLGENSTVKPYGALKFSYERFDRIKEKDGTLGMDVKETAIIQLNRLQVWNLPILKKLQITLNSRQPQTQRTNTNQEMQTVKKIKWNL